jgi:hypothetical protein
MTTPQLDTRTPKRRQLDEELAEAPLQAIPEPVAGEEPRPVEDHLRHQRPIAVVGVVEGGVVRLLDTSVMLPEHSKVIVVASEAG